MQFRRVNFLPTLVAAMLAMLLTSCTTTTTTKAPQPVAQLKDGELPVPADYKTWPKFLSAVQRPDAKQVREIYMNPPAKAGTAAAGFPNGTVFVMENFAIKLDASGTPVLGPDGKLVKGDLLRVFVMGKNAGWGQSAPEGLKNGDWIYAAYLPGGAKAPDATAGCRACHLPLGSSKDFVHRYDEYFSKPAASAAPHDGRVLAQRQ